MTLTLATIKARRYSSQYNTHWYVKQIGASYEPYAYCDEDEAIVTFYCGKKVTN